MPGVLKSIAVKYAMIYIIILSHAQPIQYTKCCGQTAAISQFVSIADQKCPPPLLATSSARCQRVDFELSAPCHTCHVRHWSAITWPAAAAAAAAACQSVVFAPFRFSTFSPFNAGMGHGAWGMGHGACHFPHPLFHHPVFN